MRPIPWSLAWLGLVAAACGSSPAEDGGDTCGECLDVDASDGDASDDARTEDAAPDDGGEPPELCNALDDDGDGATDEGFACIAGALTVCATECGGHGVGTCTASCALPAPAECSPLAETCNGVDDNCDGVCDDGFACCARATLVCGTRCGSHGTLVCDSSCTPGICVPPDETCNGADDDCDGTCDEEFECCAGSAVSCTTSCGTAGTAVCTADCVPGECVPPVEACGNGVDDDCDTVADDDCVANDTCDGAAALALGVAASGTTNDASDGSSGPCGGGGSADVNYFFDLAERSDVFVETSGSSFDTLVYASATCGAGDLGCNDDVYWGAVRWSGMGLRDLPAGRYYLAVDGYDAGSHGDFRVALTASATAPDGDRCGSPQLIPRPAEGSTVTTIAGDTCGLGDDATASCGGGGGSDSVYWFGLSETRHVRLDACTAGTTADTVLSLRRSCADDATEAACNDDAAAGGGCSTLEADLDAGLWFLLVDTASGGSCGAYQLDVTGL